MKHIVTYLEYTKENHDLEYPGLDEEGEEVFRGRVRKDFVEADDTKSAFTKYMETLKDDGWELYAWSAIIKNGIVRRAFHVANVADTRHCYGYDIRSVITTIAPNAQMEWFE